MEIDGQMLTQPVRRLLGDATAEVETFSAKPLGGGFAETSGGGLGKLCIEGSARSMHGLRSFSMVAKGLADGLTGSADPRDWNYWKREPLAYASELLATLPPGIAAPVCYGVDLTASDRAMIFMERVPEDKSAWTFETYRRAADGLGRFNGAYLAGEPRPDFPWMLPGRLGNWVGHSGDVLARLREEAREPVLKAWLSEGTLDRTRELWHRRHRLIGALRSLPVCLCHHDAFRRNLMVRADRGEAREFVAIDWSMLGPGAVGEELAPMVGVSLQFMDVSMDVARDFEQAIFAGYLAGLRSAGWTGPDDAVRLGFTASTALLQGLGAFGVWLPFLRDPVNGPAGIERMIGISMDAFLSGMAKLQWYLLDLGDEALSLAGECA